MARRATYGSRSSRLGPAGHGGHAMAIHAPLEGFESKLVKGAPYSADSVTEMGPDPGGRHEDLRPPASGSVLRDSEGRTRREQTLGALGPMFADGKAPRHAFINDPVAGVHYVLELDEKIARKMPSAVGHGHEGPGRHVVRFERRVVARGQGQADVSTRTSSSTARIRRRRRPTTRRPSRWAQQTIEGVTADGTRVGRHHPRRAHRQRPAHRDRVRALVRAAAPGGGDEPPLRPAVRRDDLPADEPQPRRAGRRRVRGAVRLHGQGGAGRASSSR